MKTNTSTITWLIMGFVWSIFMGITFVSIGLGSMFPTLNMIATPFVCPGGQTEVHSQTYQVSQVETVTTLTYYCVDQRTGTKTELNPLTSINIYAGIIYGLLIFVAVFLLWSFYSKWDPSKASPQARRWVTGIQTTVVVAVVVAITLFNLLPIFRVIAPPSTPPPDATATSIALVFQGLGSGKPITFTATEKALANWNTIPIMPQATVGQEVDGNKYMFNVRVDSETVLSFYTNTLKLQGWNIVEKEWMGLRFTKDKNTLLVGLAPASDMESWIVTLVLIPLK